MNRYGRNRWGRSLVCGLGFILIAAGSAPGEVPRPGEVFGFEPGADYKLAEWKQMQEFYQRLASESDRVEIQAIGQTTLGRPMLLLTISSKENLSRLDEWRSVSERLARARIDETTARKLAVEGRAVVWIDAGLHASEVAPGQMMPLLAYRVATEESSEMRRIRENVILLLMPIMNPDGLDIVSDWYRKNLGTPFETRRQPWLYHHYVGHDNNRDWFMNNMPETQAVSEVLYHEWYPQIVYNHHQTGPAWARIFVPPFSDPVNPHIHPGVTTGVNLVGSAMASRFAMKRMGGAISGTTYSMWWNGGMRTVPYFHNMIGILTETSHATPTPRYYEPERKPERIGRGQQGNTPLTDGTSVFYPYPWEGGESHLGDAVNYTLEASLAVLDVAANLREHWLYSIYRMGRDSIERGKADPFAYIVPAEQWDEGESLQLINILRRGGVEVGRARAAFPAGHQSYSEGSFVIHAAQPFRPYLVDLMEKQEYPERRLFPGGPPETPYDLAGWTLPLQMGVRVDRIDEPFEVDLENVAGLVSREPGTVTGRGGFGYVLSHRPNAAAKAVNLLLREGERVQWAREPFRVAGQEYEAGAIVIEAKGSTQDRVERLAEELGLDFWGMEERPSIELSTLEPPRVGLYQSWVANSDEGWTRWLLEQYDFEIETLHDQDIRSGELAGFHAVVIPAQEPDEILNGHRPGTMPELYVGGMGLEGALALKRYVEQGGTLIAFDSASDFVIDKFGLPVRNVVADVSSEQFFIPGSLIRTKVDRSHPLAYGTQEEVAVSFQQSRAFEVVKLSHEGEGGQEKIQEAPPPPVEVIVHYAEEDLLMSGWAMGEERYIGGKPAMVSLDWGAGEVVLFAFRPQFRGQPRASYKLIFNALYRSRISQ